MKNIKEKTWNRIIKTLNKKFNEKIFCDPFLYFYFYFQWFNIYTKLKIRKAFLATPFPTQRHTIQRVVCLHFRLCSSSLGICDHNTHTLGLVIRLISQKVKHHRCANYKIKLPKEILQFSDKKNDKNFSSTYKLNDQNTCILISL